MKRLILCMCLAVGGCVASEEASSEEAPVHGGSADLSKAYRSHKGWNDTTAGPLTTLIYLTASGTKVKSRPFPVIYSSDPNNTYFYREAGPSLDVRRLYRQEMAEFLAALRAEGLESLPWEEFGFREKVPADRAFYLYRDGRCRRVVKNTLEDDGKIVFTRIENRIIALNRER